MSRSCAGLVITQAVYTRAKALTPAQAAAREEQRAAAARAARARANEVQGYINAQSVAAMAVGRR